jgi:DNA-cytosine methyltransferase
MKVLSLFDGMSCGHQALERAGIELDTYYASEIDKYAIQVTMANYPDTIQLGSVVDINALELPKIDLLLGGSPCQSFSFAGKRKGMSTKDEQEILTLEHYLQLKSEGYEFEGQSYLFWEYMRILQELRVKNPNVLFLLENVEMGAKWEKVLSNAIGVRGIHINSALVSAQNRKRIYWINWGMKPMGLFGDMESIIEQPKDRGILLKDILESTVDEKYFLSEKGMKLLGDKIINKSVSNEKSMTIDGSYYKGVGIRCGDCRQIVKYDIDQQYIKIDKQGNKKGNQDKASCFTAGGHSGGNHSDMDFIVHNTMPRSSTTGKGGTGALSRADGKTYCLDTGNTNAVEIFNNKRLNETIEKNNLVDNCLIDSYNQSIHTDKSITISTMVNASSCTHIYKNSRIRRLTPIECERLQTVADNYTAYVSDSQRYKMLGNGWTIEVISYLFKHI